MPITLATTAEQAAPMKPGDDVALRDAAGQTIAVLSLSETFTYDKEHEARQVYRTTETAHPGVAALFSQGDVLLAGEIATLVRPGDETFLRYRLDPAQSRAAFQERGWRTVVGFQTRNPIHRAHEYIQKCALELSDGLFVHPLVGETRGEDIPADVRFRCYEALLTNYYPADRTILAINPAAMRYAGPREAIFHALVRKNYGCSHFIVGRDHAGVGNYYGTYDAQHIFAEFAPGELGITPMFFEHTFFCRSCGNMASAKTCPHPSTEHVVLSGTKVRAMLQAGETPPIEFTRPEIARILIEASRQ
jgi:sulfate adenylyltransferase